MAKNRQIRKDFDESAVTALRTSLLARLDDVLAQPLSPALYLVSTPIGHLADITLRALRVLAGADVVYCEDTRHSRHLFAQYGMTRNLRPYHEHNADRERPRIIEALSAGNAVALISDAGTPLISDPGYKLVREAIEAGHDVIGIPGASAVMSALVVSGLPTACFLFAGFLPPRQAARRTRLAELAEVPATLVFFEAPARVKDCLTDMCGALGGDRQAAIARELTKLHEEVIRGTLSELAEHAVVTPPRGEIVLVVAPPQQAGVDDPQIIQALRAALARTSVRDASREVAEALGVARGRVYDLAVRIKQSEP